MKRLPHLLNNIQDVSSRIWQRGWAEANAGNLSIKITDDLYALGLVSELDTYDYYLVSRSGSRYREFSSNLTACLVLVACSKSNPGKALENQDWVYPLESNPTSEWQSHRMIHKFMQESNPSYKCILHTHPTEVIALSQLPVYQNRSGLNETLMQVLPEMKYYLPQGIAMASYAEPGSEELMLATKIVLSAQKALIWQAHGLLTFGKDLNEALDYLEIVNKAAKVWFLMQRG